MTAENVVHSSRIFRGGYIYDILIRTKPNGHEANGCTDQRVRPVALETTLGEAKPLALLSSDASLPGTRLVREVRRVVGPDARIIWRGAELDLYSRDQADIPRLLSGLLERAKPDLVVQPQTAEDVANLVALANDLGVPVVPRGAASFPLGGCLPTRGGIVLDLCALRRIVGLDPQEKLADVEPGVRWFQLHEFLKGEGLALKTYPSSFFSTIGGWVATGGFGLNGLRFGHFSTMVRRLQVVTPTGGLVWVDRASPDFDLYFGTEGQFGVVTRIVFEIRDPPTSQEQRLLHFDSREAAFAFASQLLDDGRGPVHMSYFDSRRMHTFNRLAPRVELSEKHSLLIQTEDGVGLDRIAGLLNSTLGATEGPRHHASYLWRERFFPLKPKKLGPGLLGAELMLPLDQAAACFARWQAMCEGSRVDAEIEAHFIDGRRVLGLCTFLTDPREERGFLFHSAIAVAMVQVGLKFGGRPYGTGLWQSMFLEDRFGEEKVERLRLEKRQRDPKGILNPGKFFGVRSRRLDVLGVLLHPTVAKAGVSVLRPLLPLLSRLAYREPAEHGEALEASAIECSACGACVPICPAYLATNSELVTGRGKLQVGLKLLRREPVAPEDAQAMFLCIHCGACERVCQSELPLLKAYEALESMVDAAFGLPEERLKRFTEKVQVSEEYRQLLGRGMVPASFYTYKREGGRRGL